MYERSSAAPRAVSGRLVLCGLLGLVAGNAWACTAVVDSAHAPHFQQAVSFPGTALLSPAGPEFRITGLRPE